MKRPNLFGHARKELIMDAFFAWLLQWAEPGNEVYDPELHLCGIAFAKMLLGKEEDTAFRVESITADTQKNHIDVQVCINNDYCIIIENKLNTGEHSGQLERYQEEAKKECAKNGWQLVCVYIKTGYYSQASLNRVKQKGYKTFDRKQLLAFFEQHPAENVIYKDFIEYLKSIEETEHLWQKSPIGAWYKEPNAWNGLYQFLDKAKRKEEYKLGWGYVPNPSKGFMGFWWHFLPYQGYEVYWQIEKEGKLCLKIGSVAENRKEKRNQWTILVLKQAKESGHKEIQRPQHPGNGRSMTVAVVERRDWLGADNETVDAKAVVEHLEGYARFLDECVAAAEGK